MQQQQQQQQQQEHSTSAHDQEAEPDHLESPAGMLEEVRQLLQQDTDTQVISNCMSVLDKVRLGV